MWTREPKDVTRSDPLTITANDTLGILVPPVHRILGLSELDGKVPKGSIKGQQTRRAIATLALVIDPAQQEEIKLPLQNGHGEGHMWIWEIYLRTPGPILAQL